jgi:4-hydroxybenzoate polyprenyltransferase
VYAFNDLRDVESDRLHPLKCKRPIASGELGEREALWLSGVLAAGALGAAALLAPMLVLVAAGYLVNNLLYSLLLKRIAFLDVALIGVGFLLRVLAGAYAIDVPISPWLLACTALLACLLGFGKRAHELLQAAAHQRDANSTRAALAGYTVQTLQVALVLLAICTSVAYALYTRDAHTISFFGTDRLIWTLPFCIIGIARFLQLALWRPTGESPTDAILRDWPFLLNITAWGAAVVSIIYLL